MVRISKNILTHDVEEQILNQFADTIADVTTRRSARHFLEELLGPEEQVLFAKRLAVMLLLLQDISFYRIAKILKMSPTTVSHIHQQLKKKECETLVAFLEKQKKKKDFWKQIEILLQAGLPPQGKGRVTWLDRHFDAK